VGDNMKSMDDQYGSSVIDADPWRVCDRSDPR